MSTLQTGSLLFASFAFAVSTGCSGTVSSPLPATGGAGGVSAASGASSAQGGGAPASAGAFNSAGGATAPGSGGSGTAGVATPSAGGTAGAATPGAGGTAATGFGSGGMSSSAGASSTAGTQSAAGMLSSGGTPGTANGGKAGAGGRSAGGAGVGNGGGGKASAGASSMGGAPAGGATTGGAPSAGGSGGQPFKGVANSACADLTTLKTSWWYNWTLSPGSCAVREFVPIVSGKNEKTNAAVANAITQVSNAGYKTVLGFNEPNKIDQSNMTVAQVLGLWPSLTSNAALRVGSTATSADAQAWFSDFMTQVAAQSLRVDFIAVHWYGWNAGSCDANAVQLENYIKWAEAIPGNRPIWITEWGCMNQSNPNRATVEAFFTGALAMFARHPRIERYAWYPWLTHNELIETSGALTPLGRLFADAPAYK